MAFEAVRSMVWRAAWAVDHDPGYDYKLGSAPKVLAAATSFEVAAHEYRTWAGAAGGDADGGPARVREIP
jgi:alkylation response protein AidB-like acyl-CoA dehydrogenase